MRAKRTGLVFLLVAASIMSLTNCAIRREADSLWSSSGNEAVQESTVKIYSVKQNSVNGEDVLNVFLGLTIEEAEDYWYFNLCEIKGKTLAVSLNHRWDVIGMSSDQQIDSVGYWDNNEGAYDCYSAAVGAAISGWISEDTVHTNLPMEELESCSREEAMEVCQPYANVLGYGDAEVATYAITLDVIEENAWQYDPSGAGNHRYHSAPGPGFEVVTYKQRAEVEANGTEEEWEELYDYFHNGATDRGIPWEKKHEVMLLLYYPKVDGYVLDGNVMEFMYILYSPFYEAPIEISGDVVWEAGEVIEEKPLISQEEALGTVMMMKGFLSEEEIEVQDISLVYALQTTMEDGEEVDKAVPCWKVEYIYNDLTYKVLIDAVYGDKYVRYPGV